ncbi:amidohydrolase [Caldithrix abyssi]
MKTFLFYNARIFPSVHSLPYHWLIAQNGRVAVLGEEKDEIPRLPIKARFDMQGRVVIPAFGDAHVHSLWAAKAFMEIDLSGAQSLAEALNILKESKTRYQPGQWVVGRGFNKNRWRDGVPERVLLDRIFPQNPVYLESQDCHSAWVNSLAFTNVGVKENTPDPPGGRFLREPEGAFSGLVLDRAMERFKNALPAPDEQQLLQALDRFVGQLLTNGITSIHTMEGVQAFSLWEKYFLRFGRKMRVVFYFPQEEMDELIKSGLYSGYGDPWLRIGGIKLFSDGSLGSQTAAMRQPYENQPDNMGLLLFNEDELLERVKRAESHRLATAIHAIGDRAVQLVLKVLQQTAALRKQHGLVSRIEHAQLVPPDLLPLFRQYGLAASMQPIHIADDVEIADRYWGERSRFAYPFRSLLEINVPLAFGSDAPVAPADPLKGIFSAVFRKSRFQLSKPTWTAEEALDVWQAVQAFTEGVALAADASAFQGSLLTGKWADFIVLSDDIFSMPAERMLNVNVEKTILDGSIVHAV